MPSLVKPRQRPTAPPPSGRVGAFLAYLATERGLAIKSQDANRRDLADFEAFVEGSGGEADAIETVDVTSYIADVTTRGRPGPAVCLVNSADSPDA